MDELNGTVTLGLPADPESLVVVRSVVASVASRLALPYDAVDDLRISAAEAAAVLLASGHPGTRLRVDLTPSERDLEPHDLAEQQDRSLRPRAATGSRGV